jgi:hypothetical protein
MVPAPWAFWCGKDSRFQGDFNYPCAGLKINHENDDPLAAIAAKGDKIHREDEEKICRKANKNQ